MDLEEQMMQALVIPDHLGLIEYVLRKCKVLGDVLEFGVWKGNTIRHIARITKTTVWGFDSFNGLPESWDKGPTVIKEGHFRIDGPPEVPPNVLLQIGLFQSMLPKCKPSLGSVRFLHIDSDLYSSAKFVLTELNDKIVSGTVILFDELGCFENYDGYQNWRDGEWKALVEWLEENKREVDFIARDDMYRAAVIVRV